MGLEGAGDIFGGPFFVDVGNTMCYYVVVGTRGLNLQYSERKLSDREWVKHAVKFPGFEP